MRKYELLLLVHPDLELAISKVTDKVKAAVETRKGKIVSEDIWGKRTLAYGVDKHESGVYLLYLLELEPDTIVSLEAELGMSEEILRFMLTVFEEIPEKQKEALIRKEQERETELAPARSTAPKSVQLTEAAKEAVTPEKERRKKLDEKLATILNPEKPGEEEEKRSEVDVPEESINEGSKEVK